MGYFVGMGNSQFFVDETGVWDSPFRRIKIADSVDDINKPVEPEKKDLEEVINADHIVKFIGDGKYKCSCGLITTNAGMSHHRRKYADSVNNNSIADGS